MKQENPVITIPGVLLNGFINHKVLGFVNVENLYIRRVVALSCHLCHSIDKLVKFCREVDESLLLP